jgi:RNase P subunit RPR2
MIGYLFKPINNFSINPFSCFRKKTDIELIIEIQLYKTLKKYNCNKCRDKLYLNQFIFKDKIGYQVYCRECGFIDDEDLIKELMQIQRKFNRI